MRAFMLRNTIAATSVRVAASKSGMASRRFMWMAGPRNGSRARSPRDSPASERWAASRTRRSPGSARSADRSAGSRMPAALTGVPAKSRWWGADFVGWSLDEHRPRDAQRDLAPAAADADLDRPLVLALRDDLQLDAQTQAELLQPAQLPGVAVGDAAHPQLLACPRLDQTAGRGRRDLSAQGGDRVAVAVDVGPAQRLVDAFLHPLGDDVLQLLGLVV